MMKLTYHITCCKYNFCFKWEHDALDALLRHVKKHHAGFYKQLYKQAIHLSHRENGYGYMDYYGEGFKKANKSFQTAFIIDALEKHLIRNRCLTKAK